MVEPVAPLADRETWSLSSLADETGFGHYLDTVAAAIADRFTLKIHQNLIARRMAFIAWIDSLAAIDRATVDFRSFIAICGALVGSLARHRVVSYSAMIRDPGDAMIGVILKFPNEVTALADYDAALAADPSDDHAFAGRCRVRMALGGQGGDFAGCAGALRSDAGAL